MDGGEVAIGIVVVGGGASFPVGGGHQVEMAVAVALSAAVFVMDRGGAVGGIVVVYSFIVL
jgi:hypothetical protein